MQKRYHAEAISALEAVADLTGVWRCLRLRRKIYMMKCRKYGELHPFTIMEKSKLAEVYESVGMRKSIEATVTEELCRTE